MSKNAILNIIELIRNSGSAVKETDLYALLPEQLTKDDFEKELSELEAAGKLQRLDDLVLKERKKIHDENKAISRKLFKDNYSYLRIFSFLPWVRFISLTGSNAFESCAKDDDIDLFVITAADRLWLVYVLIVVLSKLLGKRPFFCFNYLIDEKNLSIDRQSYHNAVQIYMMKPLFNNNYKEELYKHNQWIKDYLPNIAESNTLDDFYRLRSDFNSRKIRSALITKFNDWIFGKYQARLTQKYPAAINKGILLGKGYAKLHQNDKSHMYDKMMTYEVQK